MCQFQNRRPFDLETLNFQFGDKIYQWMCTFRHTHTHRPKIFYSKSIYPFLNRISAGIFTVFGLRVQCMSYWHLVPFIVYKTVLLKKFVFCRVHKKYFDDASIFFHLLAKGAQTHLTYDDFEGLLQVNNLSFLDTLRFFMWGRGRGNCI